MRHCLTITGKRFTFVHEPLIIPAMPKFDYRHITCTLPSGTGPMMDEIKKLGKDGWELVTIVPSGSSEYGLEELLAVLKRVITEQ